MHAATRTEIKQKKEPMNLIYIYKYQKIRKNLQMKRGNKKGRYKGVQAIVHITPETISTEMTDPKKPSKMRHYSH